MILLWVSLKELLTGLHNKMATWSHDEELVFLTKICASYSRRQGAEELWVAVDNDPGAFRLMFH